MGYGRCGRISGNYLIGPSQILETEFFRFKFCKNYMTFKGIIELQKFDDNKDSLAELHSAKSTIEFFSRIPPFLG